MDGSWYYYTHIFTVFTVARIDRFSQFVSTVSHFPQIWIININLHTRVVVILKIWGHYSSPGLWPGASQGRLADFALIRASRGGDTGNMSDCVLTLYLPLTIAYYPHCQAKYCPRSLRPSPWEFYSHNKASNSQDWPGLASHICARCDAHHKNGVTFLARPSK